MEREKRRENVRRSKCRGTSVLVVNWFGEARRAPNKRPGPGQNLGVRMVGHQLATRFNAVERRGLTALGRRRQFKHVGRHGFL